MFPPGTRYAGQQILCREFVCQAMSIQLQPAKGAFVWPPLISPNRMTQKMQCPCLLHSFLTSQRGGVSQRSLPSIPAAHFTTCGVSGCNNIPLCRSSQVDAYRGLKGHQPCQGCIYTSTSSSFICAICTRQGTVYILDRSAQGPTTSELRSFPKSEWQQFSISVRVNKSPDRIGLPKATRFNEYSWHIILDVGKTSSLCGAQRRRISPSWWPKGLAAVEKAPILEWIQVT